MSEEPQRIESGLSREWMNFFVLTVVFIGVILGVALTRPFIFNHVVPAVMGEGRLNTPTPVEEPVAEPEEAYPVDKVVAPVVEETSAEEAYPVKSEVVVEEEGGEMPTAVATISHTVQRGDNMINLARRYGVTVEAIIAANNISNPNHIEVGTTLLIPQP